MDLIMKETRREFLKGGLRAVLFSSFIFTSAFLGLRKYTNKDCISLCTINLPCNSCSKLKNCEEPKAIHSKQEQGSLKPESFSK